jgi:large subunit ribosomal protein L9
MATQVILLERIESLGDMGEVVSVRPGYARNYLLPQKKALRASKENVAYFEAQKKFLMAESDKKKADAEKLAKKLDGLKVPLIRAASEGGQLYGSVTSRDIATEVTKTSKEQVDRTMVRLNQNYKMIGLFPVDIYLHPEVRVAVIINIARSPEEAEIQAETGRALISDEGEQSAPEEAAIDEALLEGVLDEAALEAEKQKKQQQAEEESAQAVDEETAEKPKKAAKKAAKKAEDEGESA